MRIISTLTAMSRFAVRFARFGLLLCLAGSAGYGAYRISEMRGFASLQLTGEHRLEVYATSLEREIEKYAYFPATLGLEQDVVQLLTQPANPDQTRRVNLYLEKLNIRAGTLSIFILDQHGKVVASSNWQQKDSFIGEELAYRPYYRDAVESGSGRFFGIGTTIGEPGYYLSSSLTGPQGLIGIAVVKVGLEQLEKSWSAVEAPVILEDENGVVILSSVPDWKFSATQPLDEATRRNFDRTYKYNRRPLMPFPGQDIRRIDDTARLVRIPRTAIQSANLVLPETGIFMAQSQKLPGTSWQLTAFFPTTQVQNIARNQGALAGMSAVLVLICLLMANERRRRIRDRLAAREALQRANDELERKVSERTAELSSANQRLQLEVEERIRAERTLSQAQESLVQAGKLAIIGQLSTSIAHEINQPLAALSVLSRNALRLQQRNEYDEVTSNLVRMDSMVEHLGKITGHLKTFARKSPDTPSAVTLQKAIGNVLFLLEQRLHRQQVKVQRNLPEDDLQVWCDPVRLEQVLLNLISNSLDAMAQTSKAQIDISAYRDGDRIRLQLRDYGSGLSDDALQHLFEPFFTTKAPGIGLGLGLAICAGIVRDFRGSLSGANAPEGGAVFTLEIPIWEQEQAHG
ncbi:MAG: ATP-binding protein [Formivibrio sp.]|nr:ATP-binding protein [Formivibrio sp.]